MTTEQHGSKTEGRGERGLLQTALELFEDLPACQTPGTDAYTWRYHVSDYLNGNDNLTGEPGRGDEAVGRSDEEMERAIEQSEVEFFKELRRRGASPPSQPEGVREALDRARSSIDGVIRTIKAGTTKDTRAEWENGSIRLLESALGNIATALTTTPFRGLVEAAEWQTERAEFLALCDRLFHACPIRPAKDSSDGTLELTPHQSEIFGQLSKLTYRHGKAGPAEAREFLRTLSAKPADREGDRG